MKATLIIDSLGPNPNYDPPVRKDFLGPNADEDYADAKALYKEPPDVVVPAGTVLVGSGVWLHCVPDQTGVVIRRDGRGNPAPFRKAPGIVRAIPLDAACKAELFKQMSAAAVSRGVPLSQVQREVDDGVKRSQTLQAENQAKGGIPFVPPAVVLTGEVPQIQAAEVNPEEPKSNG